MRSYLSAGCVVVKENKILLVHPTNASWWGTYSIPKGVVKPGESPWETALRETFEETGLNLEKKDTFCAGQVHYNKSKKSVMYFLAELEPTARFKFIPNDEVDWAGFLTKEEAMKRIHPDQAGLLYYAEMRTKRQEPAPLLEVEKENATQSSIENYENEIEDFLIPKLKEFGFRSRLVTADVLSNKLQEKKGEGFPKVNPRDMFFHDISGYFLEIWEEGRKYPRLPVKATVVDDLKGTEQFPRLNLSKTVMKNYLPTAVPEAKIIAIHDKMRILDLHFLIVTKTGQFWLGRFADIPPTEYTLSWRRKIRDEKLYDRIILKGTSKIGVYHPMRRYLTESLRKVIHSFNKNNVYESK